MKPLWRVLFHGPILSPEGERDFGQTFRAERHEIYPMFLDKKYVEMVEEARPALERKAEPDRVVREVRSPAEPVEAEGPDEGEKSGTEASDIRPGGSAFKRRARG